MVLGPLRGSPGPSEGPHCTLGGPSGSLTIHGNTGKWKNFEIGTQTHVIYANVLGSISAQLSYVQGCPWTYDNVVKISREPCETEIFFGVILINLLS